MAGGAHYWIDGYNVILRLNLGEGKALEERRGELIGRVGALGSDAWIAFDSREAVHGLLIAKVSHAKDLNGVIVVSDDRDVTSRCQFAGARTMATREFGKMLRPAPTPGQKGDRKLSPGEVDDWMKWFKEPK